MQGIMQHDSAAQLNLTYREFPENTLNKSLLGDYSGIYLIYCMRNKKSYIGQSQNILKRMYKHENLLKKGAHFNCHLQSAYNKYGAESFMTYMIEVVEDAEIIDEREAYWIARYDAYESGFNMAPVLKGDKGDAAFQESIRGENNGNSALSNNEVILICRLINKGTLSLTDIALKFEVSLQIISAIKKGQRWRHLAEQHLEKSHTSAWSSQKRQYRHISEEDVKNVCHDLNRGISVAKIAEHYGVKASAIYSLRYGVHRRETVAKYLNPEIMKRFWKNAS